MGFWLESANDIESSEPLEKNFFVYLKRKNNREVNNRNENRNLSPPVKKIFPSFAKEAVISAADGTSSSRSKKPLRKIKTE